MNANDLRVVKTRSAIKDAFLEMLKEYPIEKISVTALAKKARINKSTFYLHYQDIYALYNDIRKQFVDNMINSMDYFNLLLSDPEEFLLKYNKTIQDNLDFLNLLWSQKDMLILYPMINDLLIQKTYQTCDIQSSKRNDICLEFIFNCISYLTFYYFDSYPDMSTQIISEMIHTFFPDTK